MTQRRALWALLAMLAALALVAAGCGGSSSSEPSGDDTAIETTEETTEESSGDETMTTEDSIGDISAFASEECLELAAIGAKIAQAVDPTGGFDADEASGFFDELAAKAPDEIKDDLAVFSDYMQEIAEILKDVDLTATQPSPEDLEKLQQLGQIDDARVQAAAENISAWAQENCSVGG